MSIIRLLSLFLSLVLLSITIYINGSINGSITAAASLQTDKRQQVIKAALEQLHYTRYYDSAYTRLDYPGGDVPADRGVCTDVIIRAFRKGGVDLQQEVHEDMRRNFSRYPKQWHMRGPDSNIDHRRVPNLMVYFDRKGRALPITDKAADYQPGDVVAWRLNNGLTHIGLVIDQLAADKQHYLIVHNIGEGARMEDVLFAWKIIGHYRYF